MQILSVFSPLTPNSLRPPFSELLCPEGLTRISHELDAATVDASVLTAFYSVSLLDVLPKYACGGPSSQALSERLLHRLATQTYEKCGLRVGMRERDIFFFNRLTFLF